MSIKEIHDFIHVDGQPHRVWEMKIKDSEMRLERYGNFCGWDYIIIRKNDNELYRITLFPHYSEGKDFSEREEKFFRKPFRTYIGNKFSFVEYATEIAKRGEFPKPEEFSVLLHREIEKKYEKYLKKMLKD